MHSLGQTDPEMQAWGDCHGRTSRFLNRNSYSDKASSITGLVSNTNEGLGTESVLPQVGDRVHVEHGAVNVPSPLVDHSELSTPAGLSPRSEAAGHLQSSQVVNDKLGAHSVPLQTITISDDPISGPGGTLNPEAAPFIAEDRILGGSATPDLGADLEHVSRVQAGGVGELHRGGHALWDGQVLPGCRAGKTRLPQGPLQELPYAGVDDIPEALGIAPKEIHKVGLLPDMRVTLPDGDFFDKVLPPPLHSLVVNDVFTPDYFIALHNITAAAGVRSDGSSYSAYTPNHLGARIALPHTKLKLDRWRHHLRGYHQVEICQLIEFGFPVGIEPDSVLETKSRNHGSSYMWYSYVDKFIAREVKECGVSGPFKLSPWSNLIVSPLMTAHKKPRGRRTVFDASFGELSVNKATPGDRYLGQPIACTYPKVEDYRLLVLKAGQGCLMWKRDLSRFFLQLPMDPVDFNKVGMIWRGLFFIFVGLAFGLVHSGLNGQRITDAVAWILANLGLETVEEELYKAVNYVDDFGGVERTLARAQAAFKALGALLADLGLDESKDKAEQPTTLITFLGVEFDSVAMEMRVPPSKLEELKSEVRMWLRRTTITKKELQSLLGKLFWVARVVKHSRVFLGRMLEQLRAMAAKPDNKKVKLWDETRKDITWWATYMEHYNGVEVIANEDPIQLSYEQLLDKPHDICAGDATPVGGGAWHGYEYWCGLLPLVLQDPQTPIHVKEFWVLIISAKLWGDTWTGRAVVLYCDNDAVCEVIWHKKPHDKVMLSLLREFLYVVVTKKFFPVVRKISSKDNHLADHISRNFDEQRAQLMFNNAGLQGMVRVQPKRSFFDLSATW